VDDLERVVSEAFDGGAVTQVIRPAARLLEAAARSVLAELALRDIQVAGCGRRRR